MKVERPHFDPRVGQPADLGRCNPGQRLAHPQAHADQRREEDYEDGRDADEDATAPSLLGEICSRAETYGSSHRTVNAL